MPFFFIIIIIIIIIINIVKIIIIIIFDSYLPLFSIYGYMGVTPGDRMVLSDRGCYPGSLSLFKALLFLYPLLFLSTGIILWPPLG